MHATATQQMISRGRRALVLLLATGFISQSSLPALAQGFDSPQEGLSAQALSLGSDQGSFLPPEVVPQADSGAPIKGMTMGATPGQLSEITPPEGNMTLNPASGVQSAKEMRKAAFDSLMGNTQLSNQQGQFDPGMANNLMGSAPSSPAAQSPLAQGSPMLDQQTNPGQYALGQPDWLAGGPNANQQQNAQFGNSSQTQTLTAGSKLPIVRRDTRRGGTANNMSGLLSLGGGLVRPGKLRRPGSLLGLGMTGVMLTGFGVRNGFRF